MGLFMICFQEVRNMLLHCQIRGKGKKMKGLKRKRLELRLKAMKMLMIKKLHWVEMKLQFRMNKKRQSLR